LQIAVLIRYAQKAVINNFKTKPKNQNRMKKLLAILAVAGALTACNSNSDSTTTTDSITTTVDSNTMVAPPMTDTTTTMGADTSAIGADSIK